MENNIYPKYRVSQWLDTSTESMSQPCATILFGVQIKPENRAIWLHCHRDGASLIFDTLDRASAMIDELKAADVLSPNA